MMYRVVKYVAFAEIKQVEWKSLAEKVQISNRRGQCEDRRSFGPPVKFPFFDNLGKLVKIDRRTIPDRRIANIQVKEDHLTFDSKIFKN